MLISICIPCYRSSKTLDFVVDEIQQTFAKQDKYDYQLVLVNDGSPDNTFEVISKICEKDPKIIGVDLSRNYGKQSAKIAALNYVDGDVIVYMDDDGQHPANGIIPLAEKVLEGYDIVYAKFPKKKHSLFKRATSKLYQKISESIGNKPKGISVSAFAAWSKVVAKTVLKYHSPFPAPGIYLSHVTSKIANIDMEHRKRYAGETTFTFFKLMGLAITALTNFSIIPLRLASYAGIICSVFGFLFGLFIIVRKLIHPHIFAGYSSMIATILFIGGLIMLMLGMIGEYVGRIYMTVSDMPQYNVRTALNTKVDI